MKKETKISKVIAGLALSTLAVTTGFSQSNLGAACGCPPVASRPTVLLSSLPGFTAISGTYGGELTSGATLTCDNTYIIDQKIYIPSGKTLNIAPGTVLKGRANQVVNGTEDKATATALVIMRGGKINAEGSADCQVVFTAEADPMDGTYPIANKGMWGGVVMLGKATNNLTLAANGPFVPGGSGKLAVADGLGTIEGFATSNSQDQYGANLSAGESFDDNDNSGVLRYASIRHAGANLVVGAEINGLTMGSVGRGTTIDHIEIVSCADDNIEWFGGTVNMKYVASFYGNDDMIDFDCGYTGKNQFFFGLKTDATASADNDNGFEMDSDDNKSNLFPRSNPSFYNVTLVGNAKSVSTADNSSLAGICAKELTGGEIYNSIFANFFRGFDLTKSVGARTGGSEAYHNWSTANGNGTNILKVKCNTFVGCTSPITVGRSTANVVSADTAQFYTTDKNVAIATNALPGFDYTFTINNTTNTYSKQPDFVPNPAIVVAGCPTPPVDGFYRAANYRGAFSSNAGENWLSNWSYAQVLNITKGLVACPTDVNGDGTTNVTDFLQLSSQFGLSCN
ncbi:MAG: hypothetical protein ACK48V_06480 [Crocinitomicaceae bacterium]|jgi:hypothetical protein